MKNKITLLMTLAGFWLFGQADSVTFQVDMTNYSGSFTTVNLNGDFNGWCGGCNPMSDANADGIWEVQLPLTADSIEFKFTLDGWTAQENFSPGGPCTKTTNGFTNRFLIIPGDTVLPVVCYNSCAACAATGNQVSLPITFEDTAVDYTTTDFGGNASQVVVDPTDPNNMVLEAEKTAAAQTWAGTTLSTPNGLASAIPFTATDNIMTVRVWSPDSGIEIRLKAEDKTDPTKSVETVAMTTTASAWETLTFDFSNEATGTAAINYGYTYDMVSIFFNFGVDGATAGAKTYYCDDITFGTMTTPFNQVDLPITYEDTAVDYTTSDFGGNASQVVVDPTLATNMVLELIKDASAQTWAGTTLSTSNGLASAIPFTANDNIISVRVWSPDSGIDILLKAEDKTDPSKSVETITATTVAGAWETLEFDFTNNVTGTPAIDYSNTYDLLSIFFNFGVDGATAGAKTYYCDDITFGPAGIGLIQNELAFFSLSPNPSQGNFRLQAELPRAEKANIVIRDLQGRVLQQRAVQSRLLQEDFDISGLPAGIYLISVQGESFQHSEKLFLSE